MDTEAVNAVQISKNDVSPSSRFHDVDTKKLVCIEYPGYIRNVEKMLATMGGEKKISETFYKNKCRLQMTYRPEDTFAHEVCGDLTPCRGVLMKIRRRRRKNVGDTPTAVDNNEIVKDVVGVVNDEYKFTTLMDYQYLPPEPIWDYFKNIHDSELGRKDIPPFFPPPTFGRIDTCGTYNYRPNPEPVGVMKSLHEKFENRNLSEKNDAPRKKRQSEAMASLYHIDNVPGQPTENSIEFIKRLETSSDAGAVVTVRKMFEERPIWSKLAINCYVNVSLERLKKILSRFAYYWLSGPWRTLWCRLGYDPRKDMSAKIYQMVEFRVRESAKTKGIYSILKPKTSMKDYVPRNLQTRSHRINSSVLGSSLLTEADDKEVDDKKPYIFYADKVPHSRNGMYQLCDIYDKEVNKIALDEKNIDTKCKEREGWFVPGTMALIRQQMSKSVIKSLEREKSKRKGLLEDDEPSELLQLHDGDKNNYDSLILPSLDTCDGSASSSTKFEINSDLDNDDWTMADDHLEFSHTKKQLEEEEDFSDEFV